MTDTTSPPDLGNIDPARIQDAFTARELGLWEVTVGLPITEFQGTYLLAMLAWWGAHKTDPQSVLTPDAALDMTPLQLTPLVEKAVEYLGEGDGGSAALLDQQRERYRELAKLAYLYHQPLAVILDTPGIELEAMSAAVRELRPDLFEEPEETEE